MIATPSQSSSTTPGPKRRWLQFNLRTLLVLTLVVGSGLGVMNERRKNARIQADIKALESFGCSVYSEPFSFRQSRFDGLLGRKKSLTIAGVYSNGNPIPDAGLEHIRSLTWLSTLCLSSSVITDTGLSHLNGLTNLNHLYLDDTAITDAGLAHLKGLTNLNHLYLENTAITNTGLVYLKGLTNLKCLSLDDTAISDSGLEHLKGLTNLNHLHLRNSALSGNGLEHLKGLTQLSQLNLRGTKVTYDGVVVLQKALPNCEIYHDAKN
jgi:Leucine-rich repeat (LRR) protein